MNANTTRGWAIFAGGLALLGLSVGPAGAQNPFRTQAPPGFGGFRAQVLPVYAPGVNPNAPFYNPINPLQRVAPGVTSQQALFNWYQGARAQASLPPWMYGYNPYPQVVNYGPVFRPPGYQPPVFQPPVYQPPVTPYANPYAGVGPGAAMVDPANPYSAAAPAADQSSLYGGYNPYSGYGESYWGGLLRGRADVMRAQGQLTIDYEQARVMRELAYQAKLKTRKEEFDLEKYIRDNTPTWGEEQAKIAQKTLNRIQTNATPGEIQSGKAMNVLLADLKKHRDKKASITPIALDEQELRQLNVMPPNAGNIGLLRNEGTFNWPAALLELPMEEVRQMVKVNAKLLVQQAANGPVNQNQLKDLQDGIDKLREELLKRVNVVRVGPYLEAKKFLNDFDDAVLALRTPNAVIAHNSFQKWAGGGKTVQELADYLISRGLAVAPALAGDESGYNAVFSALASYNVAFHTQLASVK